MSCQELIDCPICLDHFIRPRCLPCLHTYCQDCLQDYIAAHYKKDEGGFACPTCRSFNRAQISDDTSAKQVASTFPINHLIMTLLDQQKLERKVPVCHSCAERDKNESGQFWCYTCSVALCKACGEFHKSLPILADHRIGLIGDSEDSTFLVSTAHEVCDVHPEKKLEMFCQDHDVACCVMCTVLNHRKCETVLTLQDAAKGSKDAKDTDNFVDEIKTLIGEIDSRVGVFTRECEKLEKGSEIRKEEIQEFSDKVIKHMDKLKTEFERKVSEDREAKMKSIQERNQALVNMQVMMSHCANLLQAAEVKCSKVQMLSFIPKIEKLRDESRNKLDEMKKIPFTLDTEVMIDETIEQCANIESLGKLEYS